MGLGVLAADSPTSTPASQSPAIESFQIRNKKSGDLLRPEDANSADGTRIVLYPAQSWKCMTWKLHPAGDSVFQFQNHFTSKTFAAKPTDSTAVVQVPFAREAKDRPAWRLTKLSGGFYQISEPKSGKALTARAAEGGAMGIVTASWEAKDEQKWELIKTDPAKLTM